MEEHFLQIFDLKRATNQTQQRSRFEHMHCDEQVDYDEQPMAVFKVMAREFGASEAEIKTEHYFDEQPGNQTAIYGTWQEM